MVAVAESTWEFFQIKSLPPTEEQDTISTERTEFSRNFINVFSIYALTVCFVRPFCLNSRIILSRPVSSDATSAVVPQREIAGCGGASCLAGTRYGYVLRSPLCCRRHSVAQFNGNSRDTIVRRKLKHFRQDVAHKQYIHGRRHDAVDGRNGVYSEATSKYFH